MTRYAQKARLSLYLWHGTTVLNRSHPNFSVKIQIKFGWGPLRYILRCLLKVNFKRQFKGRIAFLPLKIPIARCDNVHDIFTEIGGRYRLINTNLAFTLFCFTLWVFLKVIKEVLHANIN